MHGPHELATELNRTSFVNGYLLDPSADASPRFEHDHVRAARCEIARRSETCEPGAEDESVRHGASASS
jgi:hypothetical protein